ncbi:MAG: hypothetical protein LBC41_08755, partial [Clostridiales bacterium]|nr:hypothetical protein [Clostridiales bacterium]
MERVFTLCCLACAIALGFLTLRKGGGETRLFGAMALAPVMGEAPKLAGYHSLRYAAAQVALSFCLALLHLFLAKRRGKLSLASISIALAVAGACLSLVPEGSSPSQVAPYIWDIIVNAPLVAQGALMVFLFLKERDWEDFSYMWIAIVLAFSFYLPAVLLAREAPAAKLLLYPGKLPIVWIIWMGYESA